MGRVPDYTHECFQQLKSLATKRSDHLCLIANSYLTPRNVGQGSPSPTLSPPTRIHHSCHLQTFYTDPGPPELAVESKATFTDHISYSPRDRAVHLSALAFRLPTANIGERGTAWARKVTDPPRNILATMKGGCCISILLVIVTSH